MEVGVLTARIKITREEPIGCPLAEQEFNNIKQSVTHSGEDGQQLCQVAYSENETPEYTRTSIDGNCPCGVFEEHDCIMTLESVNQDQFIVSVIVPDHQIICSIFEELRQQEFSVSIEKIRPKTATDGPFEENISLTPKQHEALALAVETGYYDQPREATLKELADELGVSSSAVSQRLNAVERKLVNDLASCIGAQSDHKLIS